MVFDLLTGNRLDSLSSGKKPNLRSVVAKGAWTIIWVDMNLSKRSNHPLRYQSHLFYLNKPQDGI